jgi:hypothetical protein
MNEGTFFFGVFLLVLIFLGIVLFERSCNHSEAESLRDQAEYRAGYICGLRAAARRQGRSSANEELVVPPAIEYELELERQLLMLRKKKRQKEEAAADEEAAFAEAERQAREG